MRLQHSCGRDTVEKSKRSHRDHLSGPVDLRLCGIPGNDQHADDRFTGSQLLAEVPVLILQGLFSKKETRSSPFAFKTVGFKRMVLVSLTLIATGAIIYFLGIYIGILFMLPVCMFIHGERNVKLLAGLTVVICVFVWLSFDVALRVPLPMGTLFS